MRKKALFNYLCISVAAVVGGCTLDVPRDFGDICENPEFIWTRGEIIRQEDGNLDYAVNFRQGLCPVNAQYCMTMKTDSIGDVIGSNIHYCSDKRETCPDDSHWFEGKCERDSALHCGSNEMNCLDREKGVAEAECMNDAHGNKTCIATRCLDTYALLNHECKSGAECCGDYCMDCSRIPPQNKCYTESINAKAWTCGESCPTHAPRECNGVCIDTMSNETFCGSKNCELHYCADAVEGWRFGNCTNGKCIVSDCLFGYHILRKADGNICEKDTTDICGDYHINCNAISDAVSAECKVGKCLVLKCKEGYYPYNDSCLPNPEAECGGNPPCKLHQICNEETLTCECEPGYSECNGVCYNLSSDVFHCGSCSNECHIAHAESQCINGECSFKRCNDGYAYSDETDRCEYTGRCDAGRVYNPDTGRCETTTSVCDPGQTDCLGNGTLCCDCPQACDSQNMTCVTTYCENPVGCEDNSGCDSACCIENFCAVTTLCNPCEIGQHLNEDKSECVNDDIDNCGSVGNACNVENAENSCVDGKCVFNCEDGYTPTLDGKSCETFNCTIDEIRCDNDADEKGHTRTCTGNSWEDAVECPSGNSCKSATECGECINETKACADGSHYQVCAAGLWGNAIECSAPENGNAICSGDGECSYACNSGYTDNGKICCADVINGSINQDSASTCSYTCSRGYTDNGKICCADVANGAINKDSSSTCSFTCDNGFHESGSGCVSNNCTSGQTTCTNAGTTGKKQTCNSGEWGNEETCSNNHSCNQAGTDCGSCINGSKQCNDLVPQTCSTGAWVDETACSAPSNGTPKCSGNGVCSYTCNSGYTDNGKLCCANVPNGTITKDNSTSCHFSCSNGYHESGGGCVADD